jgi:hypothetical protein
MKKFVLMSTLVLLVFGVAAQAGDLHGDIGVTYDTKYIWRGFNVFGNHPGIHPFIDLDFFGSGFGLNITGHKALSAGYEIIERWDYNVYYQNRIFVDKPYAINYRFGYVYYNYPDMGNSSYSPYEGHIPNGSIDLQEFHGIFSFPNILQVKGLVPTYVLVKLWPSKHDTFVGDRSPSGGTASGFAHIFMLDYGLPITCPITGGERILKLHSEVVYNDGIHPLGMKVDSDWSNAVFAISTDFDLGHNLVFTPELDYQKAFDQSVNQEQDQIWGRMTIKYLF